MFRKIIFVMTCIFILSVHTTSVFGGGILYHAKDTEIGKVVEVIDGEVIKVFFYRRNTQRPSVEIIKIIGIDTEASVEGFDYTSNRLLGKSVYISYDNDLVTHAYKDMTQAHVFVSFYQTFAEEMLTLGLAVVDTQYKGTQYYTDFLKAEYSAKLYEEGRWATNLSKKTDRININTASRSQLEHALNVTGTLADKIIQYRHKNKFNDLTEIMAVDASFDAAWFEAHRHLISVITNVNKASYLELSSLMLPGTSGKKAIEDIRTYTRFHTLDSIQALSKIDSFKNDYLRVEEFLTLSAINTYTDKKVETVNIHTTSKEHFLNATHLPVWAWVKLKKLREEQPFISSIGELCARGVLTPTTKYMYTPNLVIYTNINEADSFELMSLLDPYFELFQAQEKMVKTIISNRPYAIRTQLEQIVGKQLYKKILPYIYVYKDELAHMYNKNTVPKTLENKMMTKYNGRVTRFSNINQLNKDDLLDLHPDMSLLLVEDILLYRVKHPFRYKADLKTLFTQHRRLALYNKIAYYLTVE